jgi:hypothetical protein
VDGRPVDQPHRHHPYVQDFVRPIDAGAQEVLLLAVCVAAYMGEQVRRGFDADALQLDAAP